MMNNDDSEIAKQLREAMVDPSAQPSPQDVARLRRQVDARRAGASSGRRAQVAAAAAVALLLCAGAGFVGRTTALDRAPVVPTEQVALSGLPASVTADAELINHTWGVEFVLDIKGTPANSRYEVRYVTDSGEVEAGSFIGVPNKLMHCRFNAAVLRRDLSEIKVVDQAGNTTFLARLA